MNSSVEIDVNIMRSIEVAQNSCIETANIMSELLGPNHPQTIDLKRHFDRLLEGYQVTADLLDETIDRWGEEIGLPTGQRNRILSNILNFESRFARLGVIDNACAALLSNTLETDAKVKVPLQFMPSGKSGSYSLYQSFAGNNLNYFGGTSERPYHAYQHPDIPFIFITAGELESTQIELVMDIFAKLIKGTPIPARNSKGYVLSDGTRYTLAKNCGCIILHPEKGQHVTQVSKSREEPGTILVPVIGPWLSEGFATNNFANWTLSQLEHECQHVQDTQAYDGSPISVSLLETRAFCRELDFHDRNNQHYSAREKREDYLPPYISMMTGSLKGPTHVEAYYLEQIKAKLKKVSLKARMTVEKYLLDLG